MIKKVLCILLILGVILGLTPSAYTAGRRHKHPCSLQGAILYYWDNDPAPDMIKLPCTAANRPAGYRIYPGPK